MKKAFVLGLTGGIASGKSLAADIMQECGAYIIDTDVVSREITAPGTEGAAAVAAAFPTAASGDGFDRRVLKNIVFNDEDALRRLNAITHPRILTETVRRIGQAAGELVVLVVPLLFESGMQALCDMTVTVSCPENERIKRLIKRDTISVELARAIVGSQMTDEERAARADATIVNDGDVKGFRDRVKTLYNQIAERQP